VVNPLWSSSERRLRAFWRLLLYLAAFGLLTGLVIAPLVLVAERAGLPGMAAVDPRMAAGNSTILIVRVVGLILMTTVALAVTWGAGKVLDRRAFASYGFNFNRDWWLDLAFGLLLGALLMAAIFAVELALGWITITALFSNIHAAPFWPAVLVAVLLFIDVGVREELIFRGYQLRNLAEGLNFPRLGGARGALLWSYLLTSILFGFAHFANPNATFLSTINIMVAGLFLGLGYVLTGELAIPIGLHITWNFFQGNVFGFPVSGTQAMPQFIEIEQRGPEIWTGGAFGPEAGIIGLLAIAVGCLLTAAWVRWRRGGLRLHEELAVYAPAPLPAGGAPVEVQAVEVQTVEAQNQTGGRELQNHE
jgi:uncharacterized protein